MNIANTSIKYPAFILSIMIAVIAVGIAAFKMLSVELFPSVTVPIISVTSTYPGAGPAEIETLVSKPLEDEISAISGIKRLSSRNLEGVSIIIVEFKSDVDIKYAEQQVRDKVSIAKPELPDSVEEPKIKKMDPADQPIMTLSLSTEQEVSDGVLYDIADQVVKPRLEQVTDVGTIEIIGGREREIHVTLDRQLLRSRELSVSAVASRVGASGENIPSGKVNVGGMESVFRSLGEFKSVDEVKETLVSLFGNEVPTRVSDVGTVTDTLEDEKTRAFVNGKKALFIEVYRQSGTNTLNVTTGVKRLMESIETELSSQPGGATLSLVRDSSVEINDNVYDVYETILIAILLTIITVYFFLASGRATIITSLSLPVSLVGAFIMIYLSGFSINIITLLAMTLAVGLLVDDAIVVIENIYRRIEMGESPKVAASRGTQEILLSVFAITLVVVAIFMPLGFISGTTGQFLKQFGFTIAFSMIVSFFVALTLIPMLAAYFSNSVHSHSSGHTKKLPIGVRQFDQFQTWLEGKYRALLEFTIRRPLVVLLAAIVMFAGSMYTATLVPSAFIPDSDNGKIQVRIDLPTGSNLDATNDIAAKIDAIVRSKPNVAMTAVTVGTVNGESNIGEVYIELKRGKERGGTTAEFKEALRQELLPFKSANPIVSDYDATGGGLGAPFTVDLISLNQDDLNKYAEEFVEFLRKDPRLKDIDTTWRPGRPEFQVQLKPDAAKNYGINTMTMGQELRAQVEGFTPAKFREKGREYDVRVRLKEDQRNIQKDFAEIRVPNVNNKLVKLSAIADGNETVGVASINRQNRARYVRVTAYTAPGVGVGDVLLDAQKYVTETNKMPDGMRYGVAGSSEELESLQTSFVTSVGFGILFVYLILASLYGSFITPIAIIIAFPLALCGAFLALYLTGETFSIFAILGVFLLIGVAGKNSILLIDYARQQMAIGKTRAEAIVQAGVTRLRPILMTSFALIAGTIPVAIGLNEASKQRTGMGIAIVGGLITSTLLTLIVVPAIFSYIDRFRVWSKTKLAKMAGVTLEESPEAELTSSPSELNLNENSH